MKARCRVPEYSGLKRRICSAFPSDVFFSDSGEIRDSESSPSSSDPVQLGSCQAEPFGVGRPRSADSDCT